MPGMTPTAVRPNWHVLCPVDFSDPSRRALRYAAACAARLGGSLSVLYVIDPLLSTAAVTAGYNPRRLNARTQLELKRFVARAVPAAQDGSVRRLVRMGKVEREILRVAKQVNATFLVVGTHGLTGPVKLVLGSTTEHVLRKASVPVLAIPPRGPRQPASGWPSGPVIVGIDLGAMALADARAAAAFARELQTDLLLVHVLPRLRGPVWLPRVHGESESERLTRARAALARIAGELDDDLDVSFRVARGEVAATLGRLARSNRAGILALILRRKSRLFGPMRGAVTYQVLTTAATPVLAIPNS